MDSILTGLAATDLETNINGLSMTTVTIGSILLVILVVAAILLNNSKSKFKTRLKKPLFLSIVTLITVVTLVISGGTVYLNSVAYSGGPVHWHADFEFWACGNELELRDPHEFLSNKIGTATLHEHDDKRIHLEGVPVERSDASLGKFMNVIGGQITHSTLIVPLDSGNKYFENGHGDEDGDGNGAPTPELVQPFIKDGQDGRVAEFISGQKCGDQTAQVQTFVYQFDEKAKTYRQTKLDVPEDYAISSQEQVPFGDCIIFEFAPPMSRTNKLCKQYGIRDADKCERFGVHVNESKICEYREVQ